MIIECSHIRQNLRGKISSPQVYERMNSHLKSSGSQRYRRDDSNEQPPKKAEQRVESNSQCVPLCTSCIAQGSPWKDFCAAQIVVFRRRLRDDDKGDH